jgi:hypothetical protein
LGIKFAEVQQRLFQFGRDHNISVIDLLSTFRESRLEALYLRNQAISHDRVHFRRKAISALPKAFSMS